MFDWSRGLPRAWATMFGLEARPIVGAAFDRMLPFPLDDWYKEGATPAQAARKLTVIDIAAARCLFAHTEKTAEAYANHLAAVGMRTRPRGRFPARDLLRWIFEEPVLAEHALEAYPQIAGCKQRTVAQHLKAVKSVVGAMKGHGAPPVLIDIKVPSRPMGLETAPCDVHALRASFSRLANAHDRLGIRRGALVALLYVGLRPSDAAALTVGQFADDLRWVLVRERRYELSIASRDLVRRWMRTRGTGPGLLFEGVSARGLERDVRMIAEAIGEKLTAEGIRMRGRIAAADRAEYRKGEGATLIPA